MHDHHLMLPAYVPGGSRHQGSHTTLTLETPHALGRYRASCGGFISCYAVRFVEIGFCFLLQAQQQQQGWQLPRAGRLQLCHRC